MAICVKEGSETEMLQVQQEKKLENMKKCLYNTAYCE
jgi:hypothetical protein